MHAIIKWFVYTVIYFFEITLPIHTIRSGHGPQSLALLRYTFILYPSEVVVSFLKGR